MKKHNVLGFIPARGGSKGVPGKNKRMLSGKPLIQWTIEAALGADSVTEVVVSTDDRETAEISQACGALVIERPIDIAGDASPVIDAVRHALLVLAARGNVDPDCVVLLQPTAPMRLASDINAATSMFFESGGVPVCSVARCEDNHPARMYTKSPDGMLIPLFPDLAAARRQDLPPVFHRNGALYVFGRQQINCGEIVGANMLAYEMPASRSLNIDTEWDMTILQSVMSAT